MKTSSRCLAALNRAAGREMTADEALDAFDRVQRLARDIAAGRAKVDDADVSTPEGVIRKAADMAAQELIAEKARQLRNTEMRVASWASGRPRSTPCAAAALMMWTPCAG